MIVQVIAPASKYLRENFLNILGEHRLSYEPRVLTPPSIKDVLATSSYDDIILVVLISKAAMNTVMPSLKAKKFPARRTLIVNASGHQSSALLKHAVEADVAVAWKAPSNNPKQNKWLDALMDMIHEFWNTAHSHSGTNFAAEDVDDQDNEVKVTANRPPLHFKHVLVGQGFVFSEEGTGKQKLCVKIKKTKAVVLSNFAEVHHDIPVFDVLQLEPDLVVEAFTGEQCFKLASAFNF